MSVALIEVKDLEAGYEIPVVGPVSFSVGAGETVGLTGPNGSGKSTLLGALVGAARVFSGRLIRAPGLRTEIQIQRPVRIKEMPLTGRDFLALAGAAGTTNEVPQSEILGRRLDELSAGQFQLLTVLACLDGPAGLVLLDEPDNNMDGPSKAIIEKKLSAGRSGRGVLVVSHDIGFLRRVTDNILSVGS